MEQYQRWAYNEGPSRIALSQASKELKMTLQIMADEVWGSLFQSDQKRFRTGKLTYKQGNIRNRETTNEHWCRVMGFDPTHVDLVRELKGLLS